MTQTWCTIRLNKYLFQDRWTHSLPHPKRLNNLALALALALPYINAAHNQDQLVQI